MKDLTLVILAAGMGSRYGGLKQIDKFGANGEAIIDFSIFDAIKAGYNKLVLIIRKEHEAIFEAVLVSKIRPFIEVEYAFQSLDDVPDGFNRDPERVKPWGTTHAVLAAKDCVKTPFTIINADDYYGKAAFVEMARFLKEDVADTQYAMMGYVLRNTLTDHGTVTRGVCERTDGKLTRIVEMDGIKMTDHGVVAGEEEMLLPDDSVVSMNFWGFSPKVFELLESKFDEFLRTKVASNPLKAEALLPSDIGLLIQEGKIEVSVLETPDSWFGVTYQQDKPRVLEQFKTFQNDGVYPEKLWEQ